MSQAKSKFVLLLFVFFSFCSRGQFNLMNHEIEWMFDKELSVGDTILNSSNASFESHFVFETLSSDSFNFSSKHSIFDWFLNKNVIGFKNENYSVRINPYCDCELGNNDYISLRRGAVARGTIGTKFKWVSAYYENHQQFDPRISNIVENTAVAPGEAEVKNPFTKSEYSVSYGGLVYEANKYYTLTAGHGRNFLGNGYRSLLLSDAAGNYPFLKNDLNIGRVKYSNIIAEFIDFTNDLLGDGLKRKKYGSFHYLDFLATKKLKIAVFEAVIWNGDSTNRNALEINYLNPFVIMRPQEYNIGSPDNMLMGLNASWDLHKTTNLYGQLIMDELHSDNLLNNPTWWANKYGYQFGVKLHNLPIENLVILAEQNLVRPFTYSHRTSGLNYGHNYNSLAHPYGANFQELIGVVNYRFKRWNLNTKVVYLNGGDESVDSISNGKDIFKPYSDREFENGYKVGYGTSYKQIHLDTKIRYILNPKYMLMLELGYQNRTQWLAGNKENHHYLYAGFRTSLFNLYYDY